MSNPRLRDPLRRPAFRRLALSYAVNEMGDWLGVVALSVLVFELTGSALATALLFIGTGFLPALMTPFFVARLERPPPRFVLPAIYAAEAARLRRPGPARRPLLAGRRSRDRRHRRRPRADREDAHPSRHRGDARAGGRAASRQRGPQHRLHRRRRGRPGAGRRGGRRLRHPVGAAARRRLLLPDRLHRADGAGRCPSPSRSRRLRLLERVRAGLGYIRRQPDAAAPARRAGRCARLLLAWSSRSR